MNFLGMGPAELIVIIIIALIVLGPGKLPEVARAVGKTVRDLRAISDGFQNELRKEMNSATSVKDEIKPLSETISSLRSSLEMTPSSVDQKPKDETNEKRPPDSSSEALQEPAVSSSPPPSESIEPESDDDLPLEYAGSFSEATEQKKTE